MGFEIAPSSRRRTTSAQDKRTLAKGMRCAFSKEYLLNADGGKLKLKDRWFDLDLLAGDWNPSSDLGIQ
jgi:hypothetical protein